MGRELRRKEERKNKKTNVKQQTELDTSIKGITLLKIVSIIIVILLVLYYILAVFVTKEIDVSGGTKGNTANTNNTSSIANKILASNIFNQSEDTYYVYFYDFTEEDKEISSVISNISDSKIYRVDTSSSLNSKYVTEESGNSNVTSIDNLMIKNPTLIEITNDQVTKYYEGSTNIVNYLNGR